MELAPEFTFLVVDALFSDPRAEGDLIATGCINDYRPSQQTADPAICPIQYGGRTKIKLMETLAAGLPTVTFAESIHAQEQNLSGMSGRGRVYPECGHAQ